MARTKSHTIRDRVMEKTEASRYGSSSGSLAPARASSTSRACSITSTASSRVSTPTTLFSLSTTGIARMPRSTQRCAVDSASSSALAATGLRMRSPTRVSGSASRRSRKLTTPSRTRWRLITGMV
ncbi:Uncharacterised protein [Mycobacteroides abscessus subsp. abscessus]|nr:Uncharacterised protein [Mycobacteroides abscessus subsp. abscessus]